MPLYIISFATGVWLLQQQAVLPHSQWAILLGVAFAFAFLIFILRRPPPIFEQQKFGQRLTRIVLLVIFTVTLGFFYAAFFAQQRLEESLPTDWEGKDIEIIGVVADLPRQHERGLRLTFDVEQVLTPQASVPPHILLSTYDEFPKRNAAEDTPPENNSAPRNLMLHAGELWQLTVRLKQPHGTSNPHNFDFESWMLERNLRAQGYVHRKGKNIRLDALVKSPRYFIQYTREKIRATFIQTLGDAPYAGVLIALAIGDQASIPPAQWQLFTDTGVNHLMSISGLHITMLAGLAFALSYALWRRSTRLTLALPARKAAATIGLLVAVGYALLAGFGVPAQRTVYMLAAITALLWLSRSSSPSQLLSAALLTVLLLDPWAVLAAGFWLSFGAVALIFYVTAHRVGYTKNQHALSFISRLWVRIPFLNKNCSCFDSRKQLSQERETEERRDADSTFEYGKARLTKVTARVVGALAPYNHGVPPAGTKLSAQLQTGIRGLLTYARIQWAMSIGLIPPLLAMFQQVSIASPIANAFAIPLVSLVVVPLTLLGALLPFEWPLWWAHEMMSLCVIGLSNLPAGVWVQHAPPAWTILVGMLGVLWLLLPRGFPARWWGFIALLPMFLIAPTALPEGTLRLIIFDVGQGLAVAAQTRNHALLYDTGPDFNSDANSGNRILIPALQGMGITQLDGLMLTHNDSDHTGGARSILQTLPTAWLSSSLAADHELLPLANRHQPCIAGQHWNWDGVTFEILHPQPADYSAIKISDNNLSCVLKISTGQHSILLSADIERAAEQKLLAQSAQKLSSTLLVVPHHGSKTSSTEAFVAAVHPQYAVITAGYRNRFGHPKAEVVERYKMGGSEILRSDVEGAIEVEMNAQEFNLARYRKTNARYWHPIPTKNVD